MGIDPIVSAVSGDSHKNTEVRRGLQPLVDLAAEMKCVLLGITHFSKSTQGRDPVERITGSLAFGAFARVVLVVAKRQEQNENGQAIRILLRAKSNIGPDDGGFEYEIQQNALQNYSEISTSFIKWGKSIEGAARDLLAQAEKTTSSSVRENAIIFLSELLSNGPMDAEDAQEQYVGAGYTESTIRRAKKDLGVMSTKKGKGWLWHLSGQRIREDDQDVH